MKTIKRKQPLVTTVVSDAVKINNLILSAAPNGKTIMRIQLQPISGSANVGPTQTVTINDLNSAATSSLALQTAMDALQTVVGEYINGE